MADCACLTGDTAADNRGYDIKLALRAGNAERLIYNQLRVSRPKYWSISRPLMVMEPEPG